PISKSPLWLAHESKILRYWATLRIDFVPSLSKRRRRGAGSRRADVKLDQDGPSYATREHENPKPKVVAVFRRWPHGAVCIDHPSRPQYTRARMDRPPSQARRGDMKKRAPHRGMERGSICVPGEWEDSAENERGSLVSSHVITRTLPAPDVPIPSLDRNTC